MARNPGYLVHFKDKEGNQQYGRTFHSEPIVNGKVVVFYLDKGFNEIKETDSKGKEVWKKRLVAVDRLTQCGMCD
jgi:hypothetical protein